MFYRTGRSGSGGAAGSISGNGGTAVTGGGANRVLYEDSSQNVATDANFLRDPVANTLTVGSGSGANAGVTIGNAQSGFGGIFWTNTTPSGIGNAAVWGNANDTNINSPSASGGVTIRNGGTIKITQNGTAGAGPSITGSVAIAGTCVSFGGVASETECVKATSAIADAVATATYTVTIPNAAHSAAIKVTFAGSAGAGGAVGANEATATSSYDITVTRTAGANAAAIISTVYGSATASVASGTVLAVTGAVSSISGAVGATNTFTINVTVAHTLGASTNHTCVTTAKIINANATGVTIA